MLLNFLIAFVQLELRFDKWEDNLTLQAVEEKFSTGGIM